LPDLAQSTMEQDYPTFNFEATMRNFWLTLDEKGVHRKQQTLHVR